MRTTESPRHRILMAVAGTAVAAGAALGGFAFAATAGATPGFDPGSLQKCTAYINPDGTLKSSKDACTPVDPFTEPGLTLAQRKALVNTDPATRSPGSSAQKDLAELEAKFGER